MEPDERRMIEAAAKGDREACASLVRAHYKGVYAFLAHLCGDAHLADDLTQETFAAAWQGLASFRGEASFGTWLHAIAYRKFVDAARALRDRPEAVEGARELAAGADAAAGAIGDERARAIRNALGELDDAQRAVIVLHYFQGMSLAETAGALGEPVGTIKWRTNRALARLKSLLDGKV